MLCTDAQAIMLGTLVQEPGILDSGTAGDYKENMHHVSKECYITVLSHRKAWATIS